MHPIKTAWRLFDNYVLARWQKRPSTALFWYLPESANVQSAADLSRYQHSTPSPFYLMDYRQKLSYSLENTEGILVLPYDQPIGHQLNPEAAFQYALGLHDQHLFSPCKFHEDQFWRYVDYFLSRQSPEGLWAYQFDWYASTAPWYSALAQARGASVMLRAWLIRKDQTYLDAVHQALSRFELPTAQGGFLHHLKSSPYYEEYPKTPTGVLNGFMASLISIWEVSYWTREPLFEKLWKRGIDSLQAMLPHYSTGWWSLYDLDSQSPLANVNSPRYHLLEISYLQILSVISQSRVIQNEYHNRVRQYHRFYSRMKAYSMKFARKILYK